MTTYVFRSERNEVEIRVQAVNREAAEAQLQDRVRSLWDQGVFIPLALSDYDLAMAY